MENKFERVPEDSPDRCQGIMKSGQCMYKRLEGHLFCRMHGPTESHHKNKQAVHDFKLNNAKYRNRLNEFAGSDQVKSLAGEIGLTRILVEELMNKLEGANEILIYSDKIATLISQTQKLAVSYQAIQEKNRDLLSKATVFTIADAIVGIISDHIEDADELLLISEKINESISSIISGENTAGTEQKVDY
jgi:hypothetical protein